MLDQENARQQMAEVLKVMPHEVPDRVQKLAQRIRELEREMHVLQAQTLTDVNRLAAEARSIEGIKVLTARFDQLREEALRAIGDRIKATIGSGVVILGSVVEGKGLLMAMATKDVTARGIHAGRLVKEMASFIDGTGVGAPNLAKRAADPSHTWIKPLPPQKRRSAAS